MDSVSGVGRARQGGRRCSHALARRARSTWPSCRTATGLPRATAHRLAVALEGHHLVRRDGHGRFCLGFELIGLGRAAAEQFPLAELATPALTELRDAHRRERAALRARATTPAAAWCRCSRRHALRWIVPEGSLLPLEVGSAGRVLAGGPGTPRTGWVESVEEREAGVASVSAPVVDRCRQA